MSPLQNEGIHEGKTRLGTPTEDAWNEIVVAMLGVVAESYNKYGKMFHEKFASPVAAVEPETPSIEAVVEVEVKPTPSVIDDPVAVGDYAAMEKK